MKMFIVHHNMLGQALNEFSSLCDEEPAEAVVAVLNIWNLMYNKLSTVSPVSSASIRILACYDLQIEPGIWCTLTS